MRNKCPDCGSLDLYEQVETQMVLCKDCPWMEVKGEAHRLPAA